MSITRQVYRIQQSEPDQRQVQRPVGKGADHEEEKAVVQRGDAQPEHEGCAEAAGFVVEGEGDQEGKTTEDQGQHDAGQKQNPPARHPV